MVAMDELISKATPEFQTYRDLDARCPKCNSMMILKFASNPLGYGGRRLSIIMCCSNDCDRDLWNTKTNEKDFTHWWLDGSRNKEGYEAILESLPTEEKALIRELEKDLYLLNNE
jgi:hypothetical protein